MRLKGRCGLCGVLVSRMLAEIGMASGIYCPTESCGGIIEMAPLSEEFVDQTRFDPGNCMAACTATILGVPVESIPDLYVDDWRTRLNDWLAPQGLFYIDIMMSGDARDELVKYFGYHIIAGDGPRVRAGKPIRHAVVGFAGKIVHDPHPSRGGLTTPIEDCEFGLFIPRLLPKPPAPPAPDAAAGEGENEQSHA